MEHDDTDEIVIEVAPTPDTRHAEAMARLLPQLSSAAPPSLDALRAIASADGVDLIFARAGDELVGTLTLVFLPIPTGPRALIEDVIVDGTARGQGIGEKMIRFALERAREIGVRSVDLTSRPEREAANRLYVRVGFAQRVTNVYRFRIDS